MNFRTSQRQWFTGWLGLALCLAVSLVSTPAAGEELSEGSISSDYQYIVTDFTQSGGTNTVNILLGVGQWDDRVGWVDPPATYKLSGGSLWAYDQIIGYGLPGTFNQSGGTNTAGYSLNVGSLDFSGTYKLSGGSLSAQYLSIGALDVGYFRGNGDFIQSGGTNKVSGSLNLGYLDPNFAYGLTCPSRGTYTQTGGILETPVQYVGYLGTGIFTQSGGENKVSGDLHLGYTYATAFYSQNPDEILRGSGTYNLSGNGSLSAQNQYIGLWGTGIFNQSGGTNTVSGDLHLGVNCTWDRMGNEILRGSGTYNLSGGGRLSAQNQYIGIMGTGIFNQSGGTNTVSNFLGLGYYRGYEQGGSGAYNLSGGSLSAYRLVVGFGGRGAFTQSGGDNTLGLTLVINSGDNDARNTYELSGGNLSAFVEIISGVFTQSGGSHTVSDMLEVWGQRGIIGAYNLQGGSLKAENIKVKSEGIFNQTGGSLNATTFNLQGGEVQGSLENRGTFNYHSGTFSGRLLNYGAANLYAGGNTGFTAGNGLANYSSLTISGGQTLTLNGAGLDNQGALTLAGGTLGGSGPMVNNAKGTLSGYGAITASGGLTNAGTMNLTGGSTTVQGEVTNSGTVKTTNANVTWNGTFTNSGAYISDPATQTFTDLIITSTGYLQGGVGDKWSLSGNFQNQSTQNTLWHTALSDLAFTGGGTHQLFLPGADLGVNGYASNFAWGTLDLTGQSLNLVDGNLSTPGGALYVGEILGIILKDMLVTNISFFGNDPLNIYYDPDLNAYLGGLTYDLTGGGYLMPSSNPVPLPPSAWLFLSGLAGLGLLGRRKFKSGAQK